MGYSAEMDVERGYRDSRINRIFEGTNEINRLLVVDTAMKRAMKGDFDLFGEAEKLYGSINLLTDGKTGEETYYEEKNRYVGNFKKLALLTIYSAFKHFDKQFNQEQEVMNNLTDIMMETYVSESTSHRVQKIEKLKGTGPIGLYKDILDVNVYDAAGKIRKWAYDAVNSFATGEEAEKLFKAINILTQVAGVNIKESRKRIASKLIEDNCYKF